MPWTWEPTALEYVCCFGSTDQALQLLNNLITDSPSRRVEESNTAMRFCGIGQMGFPKCGAQELLRDWPKPQLSLGWRRGDLL